jgi:hypothetical protein
VEVPSIMMDVVYILATVAFFAAMVAYLAGCHRLGRRTGTGERGR